MGIWDCLLLISEIGVGTKIWVGSNYIFSVWLPSTIWIAESCELNVMGCLLHMGNFNLRCGKSFISRIDSSYLSPQFYLQTEVNPESAHQLWGPARFQLCFVDDALIAFLDKTKCSSGSIRWITVPPIMLYVGLIRRSKNTNYFFCIRIKGKSRNIVLTPSWRGKSDNALNWTIEISTAERHPILSIITVTKKWSPDAIGVESQLGAIARENRKNIHHVFLFVSSFFCQR